MEKLLAPDLASPRFKANPYPFFARLRDEAPVFRVILPNKKPGWLVTRYDDVVAILKDERFVKDPLNVVPPAKGMEPPWIPGVFKPLTRNMLDLDAPDHTRLRALVHKAFTPRLVEQLRSRIQSVADGLLDAVEPRCRMDLVSSYALPLPVAIIADLLGIPPDDRNRFHRWSKHIVAASSNADALRALAHAWLFMRYLRKLFEQRRLAPADDLITALVQAEDAGDRLSSDELLAMVFVLLIAGHETTVNLIASGMLALLDHPAQMDLLRQNPSLAKPAIEELLRYTSPVELATERYAREDVEVAGSLIPRGELVLAVLASANRDERRFEHPERLDITREPNRHLAFGLGSHYCVGAPLARLEGEIAIPTLLARLPRLCLTGPSESLRWRRGLFLRGLEQLPVAF